MLCGTINSRRSTMENSDRRIALGPFWVGWNQPCMDELQENEKRQWVWLNGEKIENCIIEDDYISLPEKDLVLKLDRGVVLESEKKIFSVVENLIRLIPGFNKIIPLSFLMADEIKWLSKGEFQAQGKTIAGGMAIHELVNFKGSQP